MGRVQVAVAVGIGVELGGAACGAEVERGSVVFAGFGGCLRIDGHAGDRIGDERSVVGWGLVVVWHGGFLWFFIVADLDHRIIAGVVLLAAVFSL